MVADFLQDLGEIPGDGVSVEGAVVSGAREPLVMDDRLEITLVA